MPFGLIGGLIGGLGALGGAAMQSSASRDAAELQAQSSQQAIDFQRDMYEDTANNLAPFLTGGTDAFKLLLAMAGVLPGGGQDPNAFLNMNPATLAGLGAMPNPNDPALRQQFMESPGFKYQMEKMGEAVQNSAAARTGAVSGNALRELQRQGQGLASGDWWNNYSRVNQNWLDRYNMARQQRADVVNQMAALAGMGQNAAVQQGGFGTQAARSIGDSYNTIGAANAAGTLGSANAFSNAFNSPSFQGSVNSMMPYLMGGGSDPAFPNNQYYGALAPDGSAFGDYPW